MAALATYSLVWETDLYRDVPAHLLLMMIAGMTVYCAYRTELVGVLVAPARFLGDISYALYLTHPFTGLIMSRYGLVPFLLASIGVAYIVYKFVESPCRRVLRAKRKVDSDNSSLSSAATSG